MSQLPLSDLAEKVARLGKIQEGEKRQLLHAEPSTRQALEEDLRLNEVLLKALPCPQVSPNFTSRVLKAVEGLEQNNLPGRQWWHLPKLAWTFAITCSLIFLLTFGYRYNHRLERAQSVAAVSKMATLLHPVSHNAVAEEELARGSNVELLQDFEFIQRLSQANTSEADDVQLLAALQP